MIKKEIILFFQICLDKRYHPSEFKIAILCILPKLRLKPKHFSYSYQPIVLLSCISKALEKVITCHLSKIVIKTKLIRLIHFGAIARRLAMNITAILIHNVEKAWQDNEILPALTFNIKEEFNTITKNRLKACF